MSNSNDLDQESQPLLEGRHSSNVSTRNWSLLGLKENQTKAKLGLSYIIAIVLTMFTIITLISHNLPETDSLENGIIEISTLQLTNVHLDGWTDGKELNNEGGKALQFTAKFNFWLEYNKWSMDNSTSTLTKSQKTMIQKFNSNILKTVCFKFNEIKTYDGLENDDDWVGTFHFDDNVCVSLKDMDISELELVILFEPNMKKILDIIKKIWKKDYKDLNFWLDLSVNVSKKAALFNWNLPFAQINKLKFSLNKLISWDEVSPFFSKLRHQLNQFSIDNVKMSDVPTGFKVNLNTNLHTSLNEFEWFTINNSLKLPEMEWDLKLPDCNGDYTISVNNVRSKTKSITLQDNITVPITSFIEDEFSKELLSTVCWSDEENVITPMSLLINKVLNASNLIDFEIKGNTIKNMEEKRLLLPYDMIDETFDRLSYIPVTAELTAKTKYLFGNFTIENFHLSWVSDNKGNKRLKVIGRIFGVLNLSFYQTVEELVSVSNIKGDILLFHDGTNFMNIPMKVWNEASSEIVHDTKDGHTMMQVHLNIPDDNFEIVNRWELTKVLNEVMFRGSSSIRAEVNLDVIVQSLVGELILPGLKTRSDIIVQ